MKISVKKNISSSNSYDYLSLHMWYFSYKVQGFKRVFEYKFFDKDMEGVDGFLKGTNFIYVFYKSPPKVKYIIVNGSDDLKIMIRLWKTN